MHVGQKGALGEIAFIYEATERGLLVLEPRSNNAPYDLAVDTGKQVLKVQVKSAHVKAAPKFGRYYQVSCQHRKGRSYICYENGMFDILAATVIPLHVWYLIPAEEISSLLGFKLYAGMEKSPLDYTPNSHRFEKYLDNWQIFDLA